MKKIILISAVAIVTVLVIGYAWFHQQTPTGKVEEKMYDVILQNMLSHSVPEMTVMQLATNMENYTILDSRSEEEFKVSHLPNAQWISDDKATQLQKINDIPTNKPVVVYCAVGLRSEHAAEQLKESGFTEVYNLYGGIFEWTNQLQPMVNENGEPTKAVHGYNNIWAKWIRNGEVKM